jgi:hypothetical protein
MLVPLPGATFPSPLPAGLIAEDRARLETAITALARVHATAESHAPAQPIVFVTDGIDARDPLGVLDLPPLATSSRDYCDTYWRLVADQLGRLDADAVGALLDDEHGAAEAYVRTPLHAALLRRPAGAELFEPSETASADAAHRALDDGLAASLRRRNDG